jgi:hypothetical protein
LKISKLCKNVDHKFIAKIKAYCQEPTVFRAILSNQDRVLDDFFMFTFTYNYNDPHLLTNLTATIRQTHENFVKTTPQATQPPNPGRTGAIQVTRAWESDFPKLIASFPIADSETHLNLDHLYQLSLTAVQSNHLRLPLIFNLISFGQKFTAQNCETLNKILLKRPELFISVIL